VKPNFEPLLQPVKITALRPTQMTVGYREVERKRTDWRRRAEEDGSEFLGRHMIPAVLGPGEHHYIVDQHHLVRALHEEGVSHVLVTRIADLSKLDKAAFWHFMDKRNWLHPFDAKGERHPYDALPKKIGELPDDPYRSIAGELRRRGGCSKVETPYAEFLWADFLRSRISRKQIEDEFEQAVSKALHFAREELADYLPGWCGPEH
jgi:hypothetical protein